VSVALCTYQGEKYLEEQLESLARQTQLPDELIVCDDGSTDGTTEIVKGFRSRARFPVRLYLNEVQLGHTKNFEKAIGLCEGDFIFLADQDDVWNPNKLSTQAHILVDSPEVGAVFSDGHVVNERLVSRDLSLWATYGFSARLQQRFAQGKAFDILLRRNVISGMTLGFKARFRDLVLPIPGDWFHDHWIAVLIAATADVAMVPQRLVKYRQHAGQALGVATAPGLAAKQGLRDRVEDRRQTSSASSLLRIARRHDAVRQRLQARVADDPRAGHALVGLERRIRHFQARASIRNRKGRLRLLMREAATLNYQRYSSGWKSIALDLFLS
jgi:glycosyltransferase involved in cell wall biosynthesis